MTNIDAITSSLQSDKRLQLVDFDKITPQMLHNLCQTAIDTAKDTLAVIDSMAIETIGADKALTLVRDFNQKTQQIDRYFGLISHLNSVSSEPVIRQTHHTLLPVLSDFYTTSLQSSNLYKLHTLILLNKASLTLTIHETVALQKALQAFELSGVGLNDSDKKRFGDIQQKLSSLSAKFSDNVLDATKSYTLNLSSDETSGMTDSGKALLRQSADKSASASEYVATLDMPMYLAVMQYNDNRCVRETLYKAFTTRASLLFDKPDFANEQIMVDILKLRQDKAKLLGYDNYTKLSLATKMANSCDEVVDFLNTLARHAKPFAVCEFDELQKLGKTLGIESVQAWDIAYLSEKLRERQYNINQDDLRAYFPINQVLAGLFEICQTVFGIYFCQKTASVWHDDVLFFEVYDTDRDKLLGAVYLDLYARQGKKGGAWLSGYQSRQMTATDQVLPVGFIVANFSPPTHKMPACLSFDEVLTLFHEFGHGLHHLLTDIDVAQIAGICGVEWDAVELPSQFMENFALHKDGIQKISRHIHTNEPLPEHILNAILQSKNFQSGMATVRQLEFGLFDMQIHKQSVGVFDDILQVLNQVRNAVSVIDTPSYNRFANSFSHVFAGGYASGYYSYKWAELLSADAFGAFEENGVFDKLTGQNFRQNILATGGSRPMRDSFLAFRGRDATIDALLRQSGFTAKEL